MKPIRGTKDLIGESYEKYQYFAAFYEDHMFRYGFKGVATPILEHLELFSSELGVTSDVVSKEMYVVNSLSALNDPKLNSKIDHDTTLRPEGTIPCIRAMIAAGQIDDSYLKLFYYGPMFRYNRPQKGRLRQFHQFGCEVLNSDSPYVDCELIECLINVFTRSKMKFDLHINTLGSGDLSKYTKALHKYFTENLKHLTEMNQKRLDQNVMRVLDQLNEEEKAALSNLPNILDFIDSKDLSRFKEVCALLDKAEIKYQIDPYLVRGLDYYKNTVFEVVHKGASVAGGGSYNFKRAKFLEGKSNAKDISGMGWAIGYERIEGSLKVGKNERSKMLIHGTELEAMSDMARHLRILGVECCMIYSYDKNYLKKAKQLQVDFVVNCSSGDKLEAKTLNEDWTEFDKEWTTTVDEFLGAFSYKAMKEILGDS